MVKPIEILFSKQYLKVIIDKVITGLTCLKNELDNNPTDWGLCFLYANEEIGRMALVVKGIKYLAIKDEMKKEKNKGVNRDANR
jgi:hypothetical protein